ncbi:MAG: serine/threonine-protein phosphatase [Spirochaetales bacterium]|nr:serine/threonine-protein phosphatase [Spirochaetales bacterium]
MITVIQKAPESLAEIATVLKENGISYKALSPQFAINIFDKSNLCVYLEPPDDVTPLKKILGAGVGLILPEGHYRKELSGYNRVFFIPEGMTPAQYLKSLLSISSLLGISINKNSLMTGVNNRLLQQRAIELKSANEILEQRAVELQNSLEQQDGMHQQIMEELALASELQKSLLPREFPTGLPLDFCHRYMPYSQIGGDFFEIARLDENHLGIIITDVSGHGVASAFVTAMFKSSFAHLSSGLISPAETFALLNTEFTRVIRTEHYLTAFYAVVNLEDFTCTYCNAGHPKQLLFRKNGEIEELTTIGFFIGMFEGTEYEEKTIQFNPGDKLLLFTDGILETENEEAVPFGRENLIRVVQEYPDQDLEGLANAIMSNLIMYNAEPIFQDDITFLITEILESLK